MIDETLYQYDGSKSGAFPGWYYTAPTTNQFWQFTPSGAGGDWQQISTTPSSGFLELTEVSQAYTASANGIGFALGGVLSDASYQGYDDQYYSTWRRVPGMVMYNSSSSEWYNASSSDFSYHGLAHDGSAVYVPNFGPEGLLFGKFGYRRLHIGLSSLLIVDYDSARWYDSSDTNGFRDSHFLRRSLYVRAYIKDVANSTSNGKPSRIGKVAVCRWS